MWKKLIILSFILIFNAVKESDSFIDFPNFLRDDSPFVQKIRENILRYFSVPYKKFTMLKEYDFIIVGAGPAGCVLANRLTENPTTTVLLLEAGEPEAAIMTDVMLGSPNLQSTMYNWGYETEPQRRACLSMEGNRCKWPHGRGLGGSTIINYMIYTRGNRRDFDRWSAAGNTGWSYDEVLPYFIKSENSRLKDFSDSKYHGRNGPLNVEDIPFRSKVAKAFVKSAQEYGFSYVDYNAREQIGVSYIQSNTQNGWRFTAAESYLHPIKDRQNLHIATKSRAIKIAMDSLDPNKVDGIMFAGDKIQHFVKAKKEIILSAGTFETPKLLMLSGIGPSEHLIELGIDVKRDLPVGKTLYEHMAVFGPIYTADKLNDGLINIDSVVKPDVISQWYSGQGPLTTNGVEALAYIKTNVSMDPDPGMPDVELMQAMATIGFDTAPGTRTGVGLSAEAYDAVFRPLENQRSFLFLPMLLHPKSKGFLKLKSVNPFKHPLFYPNFFHNQHDLKTLLAAIRIAQKIAEQESFKKLGLKLFEANVPGCEREYFDTDEYWECYIMHLSATLHHQVGTCKMGPSTDSTSVVDPRLFVHGFNNLRVADVSIIPEGPSGHTAAYSFMIGEKVADMIKLQWNLDNDQSNMVRRRSLHRIRREYDWQKIDDEVKDFSNNSHSSRYVSFNFDLHNIQSISKENLKHRNVSKPTFEDLHNILRPHEDELVNKTLKSMNVSAVEVMSETNPSANEDNIRAVTLKNGTTYGKGHAKAKFITQELHQMNTTEYKKSDFPELNPSTNKSTSTNGTQIMKIMANTTSSIHSRKKRFWLGVGADASASASKANQETGRFFRFGSDSPFADGMRRFVSASWKNVNSGFYKMAEFTRELIMGDQGRNEISQH